MVDYDVAGCASATERRSDHGGLAGLDSKSNSCIQAKRQFLSDPRLTRSARQEHKSAAAIGGEWFAGAGCPDGNASVTDAPVIAIDRSFGSIGSVKRKRLC